MKIIRLEPQGYCNGVKNALKMVKEALDSKDYPRPIYLLGSIIHNKHVIKELEEKGAILLEKQGATKEELLDLVDKGTIIISAHGVTPSIIHKAKQKGLAVLDTTCGNVKIIQQKMMSAIKEGYTCLYIGTKGHPECEGVLGMDSSIILLEDKKDILNLTLTTNKIYVSNQTTLSIYDTKEMYEAISKKYPNAKLENAICNATTIRQKACYQQDVVDLCLVVGDKSSSNTKKLALASESVGIRTVLVENLEEIKKMEFKNIHSISITSGASTPAVLVEDIIEYLKRVD